MPHLHVLILAAGKGTRMKSATAKVLHRVAGVPLIGHVVATAAALNPESVTVVVGHQAESVKSALSGQPGLNFVVQEPQLGTGHALLAAAPSLAGSQGDLLLLSGDVPLLRPETLEALLRRHRSANAAATVMTAVTPSPTGYGRIVRAGEEIARVVEEKDASPAQREIQEINSGIYVLALEGLFDAVRAIGTANAQREYYLPDLVDIYRRQGRRVATMTVEHVDEIQGVNSRQELADVSRVVRQRKNAALMALGVTLEDPANTYIDEAVEIGADTVVHPGVHLEGRTRIGAGCEIHSGVRIVNSQLGARVTVLNCCVVTDSTIGDEVTVGPFAHLRNHAELGDRSRVGNFVELKKTALGEGSKSMHLTYLGDASIGRNVNIGAGTITCNYDGVAKHQTTIEDGAFIGSDTQLVAPVTIKEGAYVGTGTTVREDVPPGALAVSAGKQRNIEGWVRERRKKNSAKS